MKLILIEDLPNNEITRRSSRDLSFYEKLHNQFSLEDESHEDFVKERI